MISFQLPLPPYSPNRTRGMHWAVLRRKVGEWQEEAFAWLMVQGVKLPEEPLPGRPRVMLRFSLKQRMDRDNLVSRCKPILDLLKAGRFSQGFFVDDDEDHIDFQMPTQEINHKWQGVVVEISATLEADDD